MPRVPKLLSVAQTAEYLGVSGQTVRNQIRKGEIAGFMLGGLYRIPQNTLERYIEEKIQEVVCPLPQQASGMFRRRPHS